MDNRLAILHRSRLFRQCLRPVLEGAGHALVDLDDPATFDLATFLSDETVRPGILVLDLSLPENLAFDVMRAIRGEEARRGDGSRIRIIAIVSALNQEKVVECLTAGANAWIHEESPLDDLKAAIEDVISGRQFCSGRLATEMLAQFTEIARDMQWRSRADTTGALTLREREILGLMSQHLSNKQIAKRLGVSLYTVKNHVHHILEKLNAETRHAAVDFARQQQMLPALSARSKS